MSARGCFACEFGRTLVIAVLLMLSIMVIASVCLSTGGAP